MLNTTTPAILHPLTGIPAVYIDRHGRPRYPIMGGAPDDGGDGGGSGGSGDGGQGGDGGDGGKGFKPPASQEEFDRIIRDRVARERSKYDGFDDYKAKADKYDQAVEAARTDQEKAVEAAKAEGRTEALTTANARLVNAEARALAAAAHFRNPTLAVSTLDLSGVKVNEDGTVDAEAIKAKLKERADADPYLIDDGKGGRPKPDHSQGGGGGNPTPSVARGREMFAEKHKQTQAS